MKKFIVIGISVLTVILLLGGISIYYIVAAANRATYKRQTQELVSETFTALKKTRSETPKASLDAFKELKQNAQESADKLAEKPAPSGAQELKTDAVQLIDLTENTAERGILFFTYLTQTEGIINQWTAETKAADTGDDPVAKLKGFKAATDKTATALKALAPPSRLVQFHLQLTDAVGTMGTKLGEMISAAEAKDSAKLTALSDEWTTLADRFQSLTATGASDIEEDILPADDKRKMDRLGKKIDQF